MKTQHKFSLLVIVLLLMAALTGCGSSGKESQPTATPVPPKPTNTQVPPTPKPTSPPAPPAQAPALGDEYVSQAGGYAFRVIPDYIVEEVFGLASMTAPDADPDAGPAIMLIGEPVEQELSTEELHAEATIGLKGSVEEEKEITVNGRPGVMVTASHDENGVSGKGHVVVVMASPTRLFTMVGFAPDERWEEFEPLFNAVLESVRFFEPETDTTESVTPDNALVVEDVSLFRDDVDTLYVAGWLTNYGDETLEDVQITYYVLDEAGNELYSESINTALYVVGPGESSPFITWVSEDLPDAAQVKAEVSGYERSSYEHAAVDVDNILLQTDDSGDLHITGEIFNNGDQPVDINDLAAATFDLNGWIISAGLGDAYVSHLEPGESGPFHIGISHVAEKIDSGDTETDDFTIYVDSVVAEASPAWDITFDEAVNTYTDSWDNFHLVGVVHNNSDETLNIRLVGGLYDAEGKVLDATTHDLALPALPPGASLPFDLGGWSAANYTSGLLEQADSYTIQWDPGWTWTTSSEYADLEVTNEDNSVDDSEATFTGEVVNTTGSDIEHAVVIITLQDVSSGAVIATDYTHLYETIAAGASLPYEVTLYLEPGLDTDSVEYTVIAKGELP